MIPVMITGIMERLGLEDGEPIEHRLISRAIENAQMRVEGHNFEIRKHLLEYDDVMNQQREVIYRQRRETLSGKDLKEDILEMMREVAESIADTYADEKIPAEEWDFKSIGEAVFKQFNFKPVTPDADTMDGLNPEGLAQYIYEAAEAVYNDKEALIGGKDMRRLERFFMLQTVDQLWKDHLLSMDHLKEGIGLRGYAQQDPLIVYKKEGFELFSGLITRVKEETLTVLFRIQLAKPDDLETLRRPEERNLSFSSGASQERPKKKPVQRTHTKVGRNDPCPCGSGKKFKKCCGR